jgi:hypothetical protein
MQKLSQGHHIIPIVVDDDEIFLDSPQPFEEVDPQSLVDQPQGKVGGK